MIQITIIRLSALGDIAMTVPVVRALVEQHSNVQVRFISTPFLAPLFQDLERVTFVGVDTKKTYKGLKGIYKLYKHLKQEPTDIFLDFHDVLRSKILRYLYQLSGTKTYYTQKGRKEKKALTRAKNKIFRPLKSMIQRHCDTLKKAGFPVEVNKIRPTEKKPIPSKIGEKNKPWIGIAPFAQHQTKVYPIELQKEVAQELAKDAQIFLFGGKNEVEDLEKIRSKNPNITLVPNKLQFQEELQLMQHLDLMISMDSGNGHLAAINGCKVLTIWGNTHPYAGFVPFNQPDRHQITPDVSRFPLLPTSVYGNKKVEGYEDVIKSISPQRIIDRAKEIIF